MVLRRKKKNQDDAELNNDAPANEDADTSSSDLTEVAEEATGKKGRRKKKDRKTKKEKPVATAAVRVKPRPVTSNPLALHGEKLGLATALLLAIYLIYSGFSTETFDQRPDDLTSVATQADQKITNSSWDNAIQTDEKLQERINTPDYVASVNNANQDTPAKSYETEKLFNPTKFPPNQNPRQDPDIYAPFDLRASAMIAAIASKPNNDIADPTEGDQLALIEEEEEGPRKRRSKDEEDADADVFGGGGGGGLFGGGGNGGNGGNGGMGGMGGMGGSQSDDDVKVLYDDRGQLIGYKVGGGGGGAMGGMGGAMGGMGGMDGGAGGAMGGMGGAMGDMDGGNGGDGDGGDAEPISGNAIAKAKALVAVTALVPFKQQVEEYERVFLDRNGYNPSRDFPKYVFLIAQRVDVTDDPARQVDEADWESLINTASHQKVNETEWHGSPGEIVNAMYLDKFISLNAPPVLMRDLDNVLRHPEIPLSGTVSETLENEEGQEGTNDEGTEEVNPGDDLPGALLAGNGAAAADGGGMGGGGAMGGMGGGGAMGGMGGGGAMGGMGGGMGGMGGGGAMGGMGGAMGGMGGMGGSETYNRGPVAENKLVRFYDMNAVPGRIYRYRVQVLIEDPNHPNANPNLEFGAQKAPHPRTLAPEVKQRIANLAATDFYRYTEWSEATDPVSIPQLASVIAGSVEPEVRIRMTSGQYIPLGEPTANMKPTIFDTVRAVDMVVDRVVNRGSVLNFTSAAEYPHPIKLVVNKVEDINFNVNMMVLDIRGGEPLPGHFDDDPFSAPGEFALLDANGNLVVQNELDDFDRFLRFSYEPDEKEDPVGADGEGGGMGGGMPGMGGEEGGGLFGN